MSQCVQVTEEILQPVLPVDLLASIPFLPNPSQLEHHNDFQQSRNKQD